MSITKADSFIKELNQKIDNERRNIKKWMNDRATIQQMLIEASNKSRGVNFDQIVCIKDDETRYNIIHEVLDCAFIDKLDNMKYSISIYPRLWNHPLKFILNTRTNKVFTDITEDLDRYYKGIQYTEIDGVKVLPKSEEIDCYEQRFKPIRDKKKSREYNVKYCQEHKEDNARRQREYRARQKALKQEKPA